MTHLDKTYVLTGVSSGVGAALATDLMARGARLDIIAVAPGRWPQHHADAWRPEDL